MQVIPNMPHPEATGSERQVLKLLRSLDWGGSDGRAINSLNLPEHLYQRWGEIDFLIIGSPGMIAIEVKGGSVSCHGGIWCYEDRLGRVVRRSKSPLVQAMEAYQSLMRNYVEPRFGSSLRHKVTGFCTILAGADRQSLSGLLGSPELPEVLIGTKEDVASAAALRAFLMRVASYHGSKAGAALPIPAEDVRGLVSMLRPEFEMVRRLAQARDLAGEELLRLTEDQYLVLDHWEGASRIFCCAAAGCGKTLLAIELFRRESAASRDCIFVAGTSQLASVIRAGLPDGLNVWSIEELESRPAGSRPVAGIAVVDEGQQLLSDSRMAVLDSLIRGGIEAGRWAWFGDPNYQLPDNLADWNVHLARLKAASSVQPKLVRNCRNTPEIVTMAELASRITIGHALAKGRGMAPVVREAEGLDGLSARVAAQVAEWIAGGIEPSEVCILVEGADVRETAKLAALKGKFLVRQWEAGRAPPDCVAFSNVADFRGLESPFVVLAIASHMGGDEAYARFLYLALTRANFGLAIFGPKQEIERIARLVAASAANKGS